MFPFDGNQNNSYSLTLTSVVFKFFEENDTVEDFIGLTLTSVVFKYFATGLNVIGTPSLTLTSVVFK